MRILVIFTGGTIGSRIGENGRIIPGVGDEATSGRHLLIAQYEERFGKHVEFVTAEPYQILSENLGGRYLELLTRTISRAIEARESKDESYDGIIITHGTDTLQYTAAAMQYLFSGSKVPIVIVSSDYVLTDKRANGLYNFAAAVDFISDRSGQGVFVSYKNVDGPCTIHRGNRLQNPLVLSADVGSILDSAYGTIEKGTFLKNENYHIRESDQPMGLDAAKRVTFGDAAPVLRLHAAPGISLCNLTDSLHFGLDGYQVVMVESYHSGTICINEDLKKFAANMKKMQIPVFVTGLYDAAAEYETVDQYRALGIVPLANRAPIAQYMKLWIACKNGIDPVKIMETSICEDQA